jgi:putative oxidoreductase
MRLVQRIDQWSQAHQPTWLVAIRVVLGVILLAKGIFFISHADELTNLITNSRFKGMVTFLVVYITFSHLFCGAFIILGLLTRWVVALQIPILFAAVIFNAPHGLFAMGSEFWLSLLVLILLLFFWFEGGGPYSMDNYLKKYLL